MGHFDEIMLNLQRLKEENILCDIILKTEDSNFPAHKILLSASSEYFRALFTTDMIERGLNVVTLEDISSKALETCLHYIYYGTADITADQLEGVLNTSCMLQIWGLKQLCFEYMKVNTSPSNCLGYYCLSKMYDDVKFEKIAAKYINKNFEQILKVSPEIDDMPKEVIQFIVSSDDLNLPEEKLLFEMVVSWVDYKNDSRDLYLCELIRYVRFPTLNAEYLTDIVLKTEHVTNCKICKDYALKSIQHQSNNDSSGFHPNQIKPRVSESILIVSKNCKNFQLFNMKSNITKILDIPPATIETDCTSLVSEGTTLYIIGGLRDKRCFKCDITCEKVEWKELPSMSNDHNYAGWSAVARLDDKIFVIGGKDGTSFSNKTEYLNTRTYQWKNVENLNEARSNMAVATLNNFLYAIGGKNQTRILQSVERYDVENNKWTTLAPINGPRLGATAEAYRNCIYITGGWNRCALSSAEMYDELGNIWIAIANLNHERYFQGSCVADNKLFVVGGCNKSDYTSCWEVWDSVIKEWREMELTSTKHFCKSVVLKYW